MRRKTARWGSTARLWIPHNAEESTGSAEWFPQGRADSGAIMCCKKLRLDPHVERVDSRKLIDLYFVS